MSPSYAPGWYPDPGGLWELRWWDGAGWTDLVTTGLHQDQDPIPADTTSGAIPPGVPAVLWSSEARTGITGHTRYFLTPDEVIVEGGPNEGRAALYMVSRIDVRGASDTEDVAVQLSYPGYGGRSTYVIKAVEHPHWLKAMIWRYAQLARRRHLQVLATTPPPPPDVPPPPGTYTPAPAVAPPPPAAAPPPPPAAGPPPPPAAAPPPPSAGPPPPPPAAAPPPPAAAPPPPAAAPPPPAAAPPPPAAAPPPPAVAPPAVPPA